MARVTHPAQIDLCFGGLAREFLDFGAGVGPGDFARERSTSWASAGSEHTGRLKPWLPARRVTSCSVALAHLPVGGAQN
jgi:hypothetical protein